MAIDRFEQTLDPISHYRCRGRHVRDYPRQDRAVRNIGAADRDRRSFANQLVEKDGCDVVTPGDGQEAFESVRSIPPRP